jgi:hypothetical protein
MAQLGEDARGAPWIPLPHSGRGGALQFLGGRRLQAGNPADGPCEAAFNRNSVGRLNQKLCEHGQSATRAIDLSLEVHLTICSGVKMRDVKTDDAPVS